MHTTVRSTNVIIDGQRQRVVVQHRYAVGRGLHDIFAPIHLLSPWVCRVPDGRTRPAGQEAGGVDQMHLQSREILMRSTVPISTLAEDVNWDDVDLPVTQKQVMISRNWKENPGATVTLNT